MPEGNSPPQRLAAARYCRCGTRLARDNPDALCASCRRHVQEATLQPPEVPAEYWLTDQMRDALASRHLGRVVHAWRHHWFHGPRPLAQEQVAGWLGIAQTQLSRIENGAPVRDLDRLMDWARVLAIPPDHLWFDLDHLVKWIISVVDGQPPQPAVEVFQRVWGRRPNPPLITLAMVSVLAHPDYLVELEAVAVVPQ